MTRIILGVCRQVLDHSNENMKRGDVLGCVRDMAQLAMTVKEQPYRELVVINEHGIAHKFSGHFTLDIGFVGPVHEVSFKKGDTMTFGPFPQDPACPLEPPFRAGQMVTSTQDPSAGYDFTVLRCRTHPTKGTWEFKAEGSAHWWKCEAFRVFAPLKAQGAQS